MSVTIAFPLRESQLAPSLSRGDHPRLSRLLDMVVEVIVRQIPFFLDVISTLLAAIPIDSVYKLAPAIDDIRST